MEAGADVAVDFTQAAAVLGNAAWCAQNAVHAVIGTTGLAAGALAEIERLFADGPANCVVAPNFAVGAVLMMRFAELAAPWFESVEVVELHHDAKTDAPSGTASATARRVSAARAAARDAAGQGAVGEGSGGPSPSAALSQPARGEEVAPGVQVHSVRLRGLVAHQEVLFGTTGQLLTIRHDSLDRSSFMPGVLLAIKQVPRHRGFTLGLDSFLGL
jgi:4-hydroxy-tetrahydrodipicolinate reductase